MPSLAQFPALAPFLAGAASTWPDLRISADDLLTICDKEELSPLVHHRVAGCDGGQWPNALRQALAQRARIHAGEELLRGAETRAVTVALARAGVLPILIKGTPLAYTVYDAPALRPRSDTDLLIAETAVDRARGVMSSLGYDTTVHCSELFSQFEVQKTDRYGVSHAFDVHWRISTQPVFAELLTYEELLPRAVPVPELGIAAVAPRLIDALLLACVHPVMHHRNAERALWIYDVHLLASTLSHDELAELARLARSKKVAGICAHQLRLAHTAFGSSVPEAIFASLTGGETEPSAAYLATGRRWHDELIASVRGLRSTGNRARFIREVLFPSRQYMLGAYGLRGKAVGRWLLPALYMHRNAHGLWKIVSGQK